MRRRFYARVLIGSLAAVLALGLLPATAVGAPAVRDPGVQTAGIVGGSASIVRTDAGISVQVHSTDLTPGNAYTAWAFIFEDNEDPIVTNLAGHVVGRSGNAGFSGHLSIGDYIINGTTVISAGPPPGTMGDENFSDPIGATVEIHIVNHGPAANYVPGTLDDAINTIFGGGPPAHSVWQFIP